MAFECGIQLLRVGVEMARSRYEAVRFFKFWIAGRVARFKTHPLTYTHDLDRGQTFRRENGFKISSAGDGNVVQLVCEYAHVSTCVRAFALPVATDG